jgi:RNA polymerase sigma factor (sigma-70 family)
MAKPLLHVVVRRLRGTVDAQAVAEATDSQLLEQFARCHDEAAFAVLLRRHGRMVLGVCRGVVGHVQDAEDVFQATFLLLAQKAASIRKRESVGSWLHGVAYRLALRGKAQRSSRRAQERKASAMRQTSPPTEEAWRELGALLDEETAKLPDKYRSALMLCCWEGKTQEEAARQLGCPLGTLQSRLGRARKLLHQRLTRRGMFLSVGSFAALLAAGARSAAVPTPLHHSTLQAALQLTAGKALAAVVPAPVALLVEGGLQAMSGTKLKIATAVLLAGSLLAGGVGLAAHQFLGTKEPQAQADEPRPKPTAETGAKAVAEPPPHTDRYGDPLPEGAVARLGTLRWRHDGEVRALAFSPNGKILAACGNQVVLWDVATGRAIRTLPTSVRGIQTKTLDFSPDGKTLAVFSGAQEISLWEVATGRKTGAIILKALLIEMGCLAFSPDGRFLAVGAFRPGGDGGIETHLFQVATGEIARKFEGPHAVVNALAFSPDGKILALGTRDPGVVLFDVATGKRLRGLDHREKRFVNSLAFSPDGKTIASGSWDVILLSDVATGKELARFEADMQSVSGLAFTPDGKQLVSGGQVPSVRLWDAAGKKLLKTLPSRLYVGRAMALSPDGKTVAMGTAANTVRLWDVASGKELCTHLQGHDSTIWSIAFTPDGKTLASAGEREIHLWDTPKWTHRDHIGAWGAWSVAFSPNGQRMAWGSAWQSAVHLCAFPSGKEIFQLRLPASDYTACVGFGNHGKHLVTLNGKSGTGPITSQLIVWDGTTGRQLRLQELPGVIPHSLAVSATGKTAFVGATQQIVICDLESGRSKPIGQAHKHEVGTLALSPDGRLLLSGSLDRTVRLWEVLTGQEIRTFDKHQRAVGAVAFSPDGRLAASGGGNLGVPYDVKDPPRIRLWDVASGDEIQTFTGHGCDVGALAFSPDGTHLVAALQNSTMLVWNVAGVKASRRRPLPQDLSSLWADLGGEAPKAYATIEILTAGREQAVAYLERRLQPARRIDQHHVKKLIADLDDDHFAVREAASSALLKLDAQALPAVRQALAEKPALETRRRLERILAQVEGPVVTAPETVRAARALVVLERIASPEARQVLEKLAQGAPEARLTQEAKVTLERLAAPSSAP